MSRKFRCAASCVVAALALQPSIAVSDESKYCQNHGNSLAQTAQQNYLAGLDLMAVAQPEKARELFCLAVAQGHVKARFQLALQSLASLPLDMPQAIYWLESAARLGNSDAQLSLGILLMEREPLRSARLFAAADLAGNPYASYRLAQLYQRGLGVEKNLQTARSYAAASAERGVYPAKLLLEQLDNPVAVVVAQRVVKPVAKERPPLPVLAPAERSGIRYQASETKRPAQYWFVAAQRLQQQWLGLLQLEADTRPLAVDNRSQSDIRWLTLLGSGVAAPAERPGIRYQKHSSKWVASHWFAKAQKLQAEFDRPLQLAGQNLQVDNRFAIQTRQPVTQLALAPAERPGIEYQKQSSKRVASHWFAKAQKLQAEFDRPLQLTDQNWQVDNRFAIETRQPLPQLALAPAERPGIEYQKQPSKRVASHWFAKAQKLQAEFERPLQFTGQNWQVDNRFAIKAEKPAPRLVLAPAERPGIEYQKHTSKRIANHWYQRAQVLQQNLTDSLSLGGEHWQVDNRSNVQLAEDALQLASTTTQRAATNPQESPASQLVASIEKPVILSTGRLNRGLAAVPINQSLVLTGNWEQPVAKAAPVTSASDTADNRFQRSDNWLVERNPKHFAIQLASTRSAAGLRDYINKYGLQDNASYFRTVKNGETRYVLVYGDYASRDYSTMVANNLPSGVRKSGVWVRSYSSLQQAYSLVD